MDKVFFGASGSQGFSSQCSHAGYEAPGLFRDAFTFGGFGLGNSGYEVALFHLAFTLAFFGAFRISELVSPSRCRQGGLMFGDVVVVGRTLECCVRRSKTDQEGKGAVVALHVLICVRYRPFGFIVH